jgi:phosphoenolpyruvate carboxylase
MQAEARARVNLKQLVYSSLEAVTDANMKMNQTMIDTVMKFSDNMGHDDDGYPIVQLKTLQLVYDQLRHDDLDMLCTEKIGLEVPLLSMMPLSSLQISKSKIKFATEVQEVESNSGGVDIYTKVASAESERGEQCARIDFEIELESEPVTEGLARVLDQLGQNFIPNVHKMDPVDSDGAKLEEVDREIYEKRKQLWRREQRLTQLLSRINEIQRLDEDKTEEDESLNIYKDMEHYKEKLEEQLALVKRETLQNAISIELGEKDDGKHK